MRVYSCLAALVLCITLMSSPNDSYADVDLWARARGRTENGEFTAALLLWQQLAAQHPSMAEPWIYHSMAARRSEDFVRAIASANRALEIDSGNRAALWQRALSHNLQHQFDAALSDFAQITPPRRMASFHHQYAVALQGVGNIDAARKHYGIAVDMDGELFPTRYAYYLLLRGHDGEAAQLQLDAVQRLRHELPDWIRNDQLRLERGELSEIHWPGAYNSLAAKRPGQLLDIRLEAAHSGGNIHRTAIEIWTRQGVTRRPYARIPTTIAVGTAKRIAVLRIVWPHGIAQNLFDVDATRGELTIRERIFIKGSWGGVRIE